MDTDSLIRLLPELLNRSGTEDQDTADEGQSQSARSADQGGSDNFLLSDSEATQSVSDQSEDSEEDAESGRKRESLKPDLDEIEKFLDGISKQAKKTGSGRPGARDMDAILREVDALGRRSFSAVSRPPPSPRARPDTRSQPELAPRAPREERGARGGQEPGARPRAEPASDTSRMAGEPDTFRAARERLAATLATSDGAAENLSRSEPAIGHTFQDLLSDEKRKCLALTADMILLKQRSLEHEIHLKTQWDENLRNLMLENSSLKLEVDRLRSRPRAAEPERDGAPADRARLRALEQRLQEQDKLLDGFNAENARLYRELNQLKTERAELESTVEDLECDKRLLEAQLQSARRSAEQPPAACEQELSAREEQLNRRERQLERRWQEVQQAGREVERLHEKVSQQQSSLAADSASAATPPAPAAARVATATALCQTDPPPSSSSSAASAATAAAAAAAASPPPTPRSGRSGSPLSARSVSPGHVAAAATAEVRSTRAALRQAELRSEELQRQAEKREADLKRAFEIKVRALETKLRRLSATDKPDHHLVVTLRRTKAELTEKERQLTQTRRQLEKSQRTLASLQKEREKLLLSLANRAVDCRHDRSRSRGTTPSRSRHQTPCRDPAEGGTDDGGSSGRPSSPPRPSTRGQSHSPSCTGRARRLTPARDGAGSRSATQSPARGGRRPRESQSLHGTGAGVRTAQSPGQVGRRRGARETQSLHRSPAGLRQGHGWRAQRRPASLEKARTVDEAMLMELQTAIAAVEDENVQLKSQFEKLVQIREREIADRDEQIAALNKENAEIRKQLGSSRSAEECGREGGEAGLPLSSRSDSLLMEARTQMEAQENVINHLRDTIRRFQEQSQVISELEEENRSLRENLDHLRHQMDSQKRRSNPDMSQILSIESKMDEIDRRYRRRAAYLDAIVHQIGQFSFSPRSTDGDSVT